jgi:colicin import membrane protein
MFTSKAPVDTGLGVSFIISTVIHLAVFLLVLWLGRFTPPMTIQETYYVDIVNLPVASPQAGSPTQKGNEAEQAPPPIKAQEGPMSLPAPQKAEVKGKAAQEKAKADEASESTALAEKMAKLQQKAETQQQEEALARLRSKVKPGTGRGGMPTASGTEVGSDYTAYIQSRLKDAFRETISYSSRNPQMVVRLFIDTNGKLSRTKPEGSSGDHAFEIAVMRAIELASGKFTPPPDHKVYEGVFVFSPQGITKNRP